MDLTEEDKGDRFHLNALYEKRRTRAQTKEAFFNYEPNELMIAEGQETYVVVSRDMAVAYPLFMSGELDFAKFVTAITLLRQHGHTVDMLWDVGANIGPICIAAVSRGYVARAVAFEPEPRLFRLLRANTILNGVDAAITCHHVGLGEAAGTAELMIGEGNTGDYRIAGRTFTDDAMGEASRGTASVSLRPMNDFQASFEPGRTMLFLDIQGYEGHALRGAGDILRHRPPLVSEVWPYAMKRLDSFAPFRDVICGTYNRFADLSRPETGFRPLDAGVITTLFETIGDDANALADFLFIAE